MSEEKGVEGFTKRELVALLQSLSRLIQAMDEADVERLISGTKVQLYGKGRGKIEQSSACSESDLNSLKGNLLDAESREVARDLIDRNLQNKADLFAMARVLDIAVPKSVTSEHLKERLVEATVGFRVRAAAIRGAPVGLRNKSGAGKAKIRKI